MGKWQIRLSDPGGGGGPAPPGGTDHFSPKIIVGNVPAGDPALPQLFPFRYIPDTGNGAGLALALAEAALAGKHGDVYLRPGVYDFGLLGSPALPLAVPPGTSLRGPAPGLVAAVGGTPDAGALIRCSPSSRATFTLGAASSLRQLGIELTTPTPGAVGLHMVEGALGGLPSFIDQIAVWITAPAASAVDESLTHLLFSDGFFTTTNVAISTFGAPSYLTGSLIGIEAPGLQASAVLVQGVDRGFELAGGGGGAPPSVLDNCEVIGCPIGISIAAGAFGVRVVGCVLLLVSARGVINAGDSTVLDAVTCVGEGAVGSLAFEMIGSRSTVSALRATGYENGLSSTENALTGAALKFDGVGAAGSIGIDLSGGSNTVLASVTLEGFERGYVDGGPRNQLSTANIGCLSAAGVPAIDLLGTGFNPKINDTFCFSTAIGVRSAASTTQLSGVSVHVDETGFILTGGLFEAQLDNCRSAHSAGPAVGTALLVDPGADDVTAMGFHARSHAIGIDYGGDYFTSLGANLRGIPVPVTPTGAPVGSEIAHTQT